MGSFANFRDWMNEQFPVADMGQPPSIQIDTSEFRGPLKVDPMATIRGRAAYQQGVQKYLDAVQQGVPQDEALAASGLASPAPPVQRNAGPEVAESPARAAVRAALYDGGDQGLSFQPPPAGYKSPGAPQGGVAPVQGAPGGGGGQRARVTTSQAGDPAWGIAQSPDTGNADRLAVLEKLFGGLQYQRPRAGEQAMLDALADPKQRTLTPEEQKRQRRQQTARSLVRSFALGMGGEWAQRALQADALATGEADKQKAEAQAADRESRARALERAKVISGAENTDFERGRQQLLDALGLSREMRELSKPQGTVVVTTPDGQKLELDANDPLVKHATEQKWPVKPTAYDEARIREANASADAANALAESRRWGMTPEGVAALHPSKGGGAGGAGGMKLAPYNPQAAFKDHINTLKNKRAKLLVKQQFMQQGDNDTEPTDEQIKAMAATLTPTPEEITAATNYALDAAAASQQLAGGGDEGEDELRPQF